MGVNTVSLYLFSNFNNYYNRTLKVYASIGSYGTPTTTLPGTNFNPNDGVTTTHKVTGELSADCDYLVVVDSKDAIVSRWFIMEVKRLSGSSTMGQYQIELRRDLLADNWDSIKDAPCYVEKAILPNTSPFIFNKEDMTVNQIKTSETLLKDETGVAWLVGYYARTGGNNQTTQPSATYTPEFPYQIDLNGDITTWTYYNYVGNNLTEATDFESKTIAYNWVDGDNFNIDYYGPDSAIGVTHTTGTSTYHTNGDPTTPAWKTAYKNLYDTQYNNILIAINGALVIPESTANTLMSLTHQVIRYTTDGGQTHNYKKIHCSRGRVTTVNVLDTSSIVSGFLVNMRSSAGLCTGTAENTTDTIYAMGDGVVLYLEDISPDQITATISSTRYFCNDQPYDIFAIPYPDADSVVRIWDGEPGNSTYVDCTRSTGWNIVNAMIEQNGAIIKDVQLLPYCPVRSIITTNNQLTVNGDTKLYTYIMQGATEVGVIFNASSSSFSFEIPVELRSTNIKIDNQCDFYRFCSPNYNGQFEFNLAKNGGAVDYIDVDCAYKPFNPYIHLAPGFSQLYGEDFNDARGLICNGDFSITQISDAWTQYQIQNKNYQAMFDRQIENMEYNYKMQNIGSIISGIAGAGTTGAGIGMLAGAGVGIAAGVVSAAGAAGDIAIQRAMQKETLDFTKDNFAMQLGNIQALPDSITKVDAFNPNNKIFPLIEYYTCTDEEKKALANKIKYNGMTVGVIGQVSDYLSNYWSYDTILVSTGDRYIKGQLIRISTISDDYHYALETANELYKGVYI